MGKRLNAYINRLKRRCDEFEEYHLAKLEYKARSGKKFDKDQLRYTRAHWRVYQEVLRDLTAIVGEDDD